MRSGCPVIRAFGMLCHLPFHDNALAAGMLLQQRQREAIEPCEVLAQVLLPDPRLILASKSRRGSSGNYFRCPVAPDGVANRFTPTARLLM